MKSLVTFIAATVVIVLSGAAGGAWAQGKPQCEAYCYSLCQARIAKGLTQAKMGGACTATCIAQNRGGRGGQNTSVKYGHCT
jgi:hypothetical protein